jgi:putative flippase GtrA
MENNYWFTFNDYITTIYPYIILGLIGLIESFLISYLLKRGFFNYKVIQSVLIANILSFVIEYVLSYIVSHGDRLFIWIPWMKTNFFVEYYISFPVILLITILIECIINWILLKSMIKLNQIIKATMIANVITWMILIICINGIAFSKIEGEKERYIIDEIPLNLNKNWP